MPRLIEQSRREHGSLSLVLIDLDRFKRINDEFGHHAGDRALKHLVRILEDLLEDDEILVRLSGEEFVLVLRKPAGAAWERADSMRRAVAESRFVPERLHDPLQITFSAGVACCPSDGTDLSNLLRRADQRLRVAKQGGRNRVLLRED
jgi:diguanylate cyclase (GGDEF)-like protein